MAMGRRNTLWIFRADMLKSKAFTLFATHFLELTNLANYFLNVSKYSDH